MKYLTLEQIKQHLRIDPWYRDDDIYLVDLGNVAETVVERHIDDDLAVIASENGGELPSPLLHAMLFLVGNFYASRESVQYAATASVPLTYEYLIALYQRYSNRINNSSNICNCNASESTQG
jgi:hypothetical protein